MNTKIIKQDIDSLIRGLSTILSKNRCSLTDEERVLLQDCMKQLELQKQQVPIDWTSILNSVSVIARFFISFKDLLF